MSDQDEVFITEDALIAYASALLLEMVNYGEKEAELLSGKQLSTDQEATVMKANVMLTFATMSLFAAVEARTMPTIKAMFEIWSSPMISDLRDIAFHEEITAAKDKLAANIDEIELAVNEETHDTSSKPGS